jgi:hypothetical protein
VGADAGTPGSEGRAPVTRCAICNRRIRDLDCAHQHHERGCNRFCEGWCRCDQWACAACCEECFRPPTALAARLAVAGALPQVPEEVA